MLISQIEKRGIHHLPAALRQVWSAQSKVIETLSKGFEQQVEVNTLCQRELAMLVDRLKKEMRDNKQLSQQVGFQEGECARLRSEVRVELTH